MSDKRYRLGQSRPLNQSALEASVLGVPLAKNKEDLREQRRNMNYALYGTNVPNVKQKQQFRQAAAQQAAQQAATANMLQSRVAEILGSYRQQNNTTNATPTTATPTTATPTTATPTTATPTTATPTTATPTTATPTTATPTTSAGTPPASIARPTTVMPTTSAGTPPASIARPTAPKWTGGMIDGKPAGLRLREMRLAAEERYKRGEGPKPFGPSAGERRYEAFEKKQKQFDDYQKTRADAFEATLKEYERRNLVKDAVEGVPSGIRRPLEEKEILSPIADSYNKAYQAEHKEILDLIASEYGPEAAGREPSIAYDAPEMPEMTYIPEYLGDDATEGYDLGSAQKFFDRQELIQQMAPRYRSKNSPSYSPR